MKLILLLKPGCHTAITTCYNAGVFGVLENGPNKVDDIASRLGMNREVLGETLDQDVIGGRNSYH